MCQGKRFQSLITVPVELFYSLSFKPFLKPDFWFPPKELFSKGDVGLALAGVIGGQWLEDYSTFCTGEENEHLCKLHNAEFARIPQVDLDHYGERG